MDKHQWNINTNRLRGGKVDHGIEKIKLDYNDYNNTVNLQEAKPTKVLLSTFQVTVDQLTKHEENIYDSTEKLCRQMLKDFPNITGTPDYTHQPKHAYR